MHGLSSRRASVILAAVVSAMVAGVVAILVANALVRGLLTAAGVMVILGTVQLVARRRARQNR